MVLGKKYKRVHNPRRINKFKFCSKAPFIDSGTLQPLKMDLSFGKGHHQCGNSTTVLKANKFIKKGLQQRYFIVNIPNFSRTAFCRTTK